MYYDIRVNKNRFKAVFVGLSQEGKRWLNINIGVGEVKIQLEFADELIEDIKKDGLKVEH